MQQTLKFIVIFMGVLILAGLGVIVVTLAGRMSDEDPGKAGFGTVALDLPKGAEVTTASSGESRLVLNVRLPDGHKRVIILDLKTGAVLGTVNVTEGP